MSLKIPLTREQKYMNLCANGDAVSIEFMLKTKEFKMTDLKSRNSLLSLCMKSACKNNNLDSIKALLKKYDSVTSYIEDALYNACVFGDNVTNINYISDLCKIKNNQRTYEQLWIKCLVGICESGKIDVFKLYIDKIKYIPFEFYGNCLLAACMSGNLDLVNFIINCEDNINAKCPIYAVNFFNNGLFGACRGGHIEIIEIMIQKGAKDFKVGLMEACRGGNHEIVSLMLDKNVRPRTRFWENEFLIMWELTTPAFRIACQYGHSAIAKFLFSSSLFGNNLFNYNQFLQHACCCGDLGVVVLLIKSGANDWDTGLIKACCDHNNIENRVEIVRIMLRKGAITYNEAQVNNIIYCRSVDIFMMLYNKGSNVFTHEQNKTFLYSYRVYQTYFAHSNKNPLDYINNRKFLDTLQEYPPYVLFLTSKGTKRTSANCCIKKLPVELFRLLFRYL